MSRQKITMEKSIRNTVIYNSIIQSIGGKCNDTVSIYVNGKFKAHYSRAIGYDVFDDIRGNTVDLVDDSTGEVLKHREV